jgi:hypothetical protein
MGSDGPDSISQIESNQFFLVNLFSKMDEFSRLAPNFFFFSNRERAGGSEERVMIYLIIHVQSNMNEYI